MAAQESPVLTNSTARAPLFCPHVAEMMQGRDNPSPTASLRKDETALGTGWTMQVTTSGSWPFARRAQGRAVSVWGTHTCPSRLPSTHWLPKSYARDRKLPWCESQPANLEPAAERARGSQLHHGGSRETKEQSKGRQMTQPTTFPTIRLYKYLRFPFGSVSFKPIIRKSLTTNIIGRENDVSAQTAKRNTGPGVMSVISGRPLSLGNTREWIWLLK